MCYIGSTVIYYNAKVLYAYNINISKAAVFQLAKLLQTSTRCALHIADFR